MGRGAETNEAPPTKMTFLRLAPAGGIWPPRKGEGAHIEANGREREVEYSRNAPRREERTTHDEGRAAEDAMPEGEDSRAKTQGTERAAGEKALQRRAPFPSLTLRDRPAPPHEAAPSPARRSDSGKKRIRPATPSPHTLAAP